MTVGILVSGDNHLILAGPLPAPACARHLAGRFALTYVTLGPAPSARHGPWSIRTQAFRESLAWAVHLRASQAPSPAVAALLAELAARGITIHQETDSWEGAPCA